MADQQFKGTPRKKNALSEYKLRLYAKKEGNMTREPSLSVSVVKNQVHLDVYTNVPQAKDNGRINAAMSSRIFYSMLTMLRQFYTGQRTEAVDLGCEGHSWFGGQKSDKKLLSTIRMGFDKEGLVYIAVLSKGQQDIKFAFIDDDYHWFRNQDGSPVGKAEMSKIYAEGWCMEIAALAAAVLHDEYKDPQEGKPQQQGGNNWNGQKSGGNNWNKDKGNNWGGNKGNSGGGNNWDAPSAEPGESGDGDFPENW